MTAIYFSDHFLDMIILKSDLYIKFALQSQNLFQIPGVGIIFHHLHEEAPYPASGSMAKYFFIIFYAVLI